MKPWAFCTSGYREASICSSLLGGAISSPVSVSRIRVNFIWFYCRLGENFIGLTCWEYSDVDGADNISIKAEQLGVADKHLKMVEHS